MDKWEVYMEIYQLLKQGFSKSAVAKKLNISRTTLYHYLQRSPEEMTSWLASTKQRQKKLDRYREKILYWIQQHPDISASQIQDWLKEGDPNLSVGESTVRQYVRQLRKEWKIPKEISYRQYEAVPDPPMGQQAQVDFGQIRVKDQQGKEVQLYFIAFVLSHSRYKYKEWLNRPFTTRDVIQAHERAFEWFEGIPHEIVYDQDNLIVVSENAGDLILTAEFEAYRRERNLTLHVCRKADPESKGKIENVVGFIKHNFAKHRTFLHLDLWNEQGREWLKRTGNGRVHNTTKKRPADVFEQEKTHLRPISTCLDSACAEASTLTNSITRTVRKDNTILYQSNRYTVPCGTYAPFGKTVQIVIKEGKELWIYDSETGKHLGKHHIAEGKGRLIQNRNHLRDRTKGIEAYIDRVTEQFEQPEVAREFLAYIRKKYPRYIRDQLQIIQAQLAQHPPSICSQALHQCMELQLYSASEFTDVIGHLKRQAPLNKNDENVQLRPVQALHEESHSVLRAQATKRDIQEYIHILEGKRK
ncbi:Transposase [Anoxybacillus thermarum]|uniref:Transposase n=2 Tax=Anoxybacillus TaxID=150247 RepID=A0A0D0RPE4_9BACL|nr:IS21 family transposase [Anoxybacillus flavithermus]KIQ93602.1 Transposase [Anoxybacillus thermarum]